MVIKNHQLARPSRSGGDYEQIKPSQSESTGERLRQNDSSICRSVFTDWCDAVYRECGSATGLIRASVHGWIEAGEAKTLLVDDSSTDAKRGNFTSTSRSAKTNRVSTLCRPVARSGKEHHKGGFREATFLKPQNDLLGLLILKRLLQMSRRNHPSDKSTALLGKY